MRGFDLFWIDDSKGGRVKAFLKLPERYGVASREFDSLSTAYNEILGNVRGITWKELFGAYMPPGAT